MAELGKKIGYGALLIGSGALGHWIAKNRYINRKMTFGVIGGFALLSSVYTCNKEIVPASIEILKQKTVQEQLYERDKLHLEWQKDSLDKTINRELIREGKWPVEGNYFKKLDEPTKELEKKINEAQYDAQLKQLSEVKKDSQVIKPSKIRPQISEAYSLQTNKENQAEEIFTVYVNGVRRTMDRFGNIK
jgi:enoyl reductase-like protein